MRMTYYLVICVRVVILVTIQIQPRILHNRLLTKKKNFLKFPNVNYMIMLTNINIYTNGFSPERNSRDRNLITSPL